MATNLSHYLTLERKPCPPAVGGCSDRMDALGFDMARFDCRRGSTPRPISRCPINEIPANPLILNILPRLEKPGKAGARGQWGSQLVWPNLLTINEIKRVDTATRRVDNGSLEMAPDFNQ